MNTAPTSKAPKNTAPTDTDCDLLVIGGGVNGTGIARDAAGRGLRTVLLEQGDLAGATSSASSKLIHGGLRYLEYREFRLVREALQERAVLLRNLPHIAWPMRFVLPHDRSMRPAWLLRLGLLIYDNLGGRRRLPPARRLDLRRTPEGAPLRPEYAVGFEYSDAWVDDARLVVLNAMDAAARGAAIRTRTRCTALRAEDGAWIATLPGGETLRARAVANAAGPWVAALLAGTGRNDGPRVRLVKGSHVVVPRLHDGPQAYILQNDDRRIVFVLPYENDFSLIGTTDVPYAGDPARVAADPDEIAYLCRSVSRVFARPVSPADVVHTFSGVRPLQDSGENEAAAVTRDYRLDLERSPAPMLSVFGGKITTFRRLAEHALDMLEPVLAPPRPGAWTADAPLPGGDFADFAAFRAACARRYPFLPDATLTRMAHAYGTRIADVLGDAADLAGLGEHFGAGLHAAELRYLHDREWARTADDVLWRRTKLGLRLDSAARARVAAAMGAT